MNLDDWQRRLALAHWITDQILAGKRVWMREDLHATPLDCGPGVVVYGFDRRTGLFTARYRIVGYAADMDAY